MTNVKVKVYGEASRADHERHLAWLESQLEKVQDPLKRLALIQERLNVRKALRSS